MRQHTEGMVESIIWVLLEIYFSFQQWKNVENLLRIDKVIAMSLVRYFLADTLHCKLVDGGGGRLKFPTSCKNDGEIVREGEMSVGICLYDIWLPFGD